MTSTSQNIDQNKDPYFIPTVPMYVENLGQDNDDTLGDEFFKLLALDDAGEDVAITNNLRTPQSTRPRQRSQRHSMLQKQNVPADRTRRSVLRPQNVPQMRFDGTASSQRHPTIQQQNASTTRRSVLRPQQNVPPPAATARRSVLCQQQNGPPPSAATTRRSVLRPQQSVPLPMRSEATTSAHLRSIDPDLPSTSAAAAHQKPISTKPFLQPPMRFGNIAPATPAMTTRGRGKADGVSHGVRGISIPRPPSRLGNIEKQQEK